MLHPQHGVYVQAAAEILRKLQGTNYDFFLGFFEIYQGHLYDLLQKKQRIHAREDKHQQVQIVGLRQVKVQDVRQFCAAVDAGITERRTGVTGANSDSSRSHAILQICLRPKSQKAEQQTYGKISFIDLAGSERGADREEVDRKTKLEGSEINKSLLALKECIRAMDLDSSHLPFRQSKLTQVPDFALTTSDLVL